MNTLPQTPIKQALLSQKIAAIIKEKRSQLQFKQEIVAKEIGMSQANYSKIENGLVGIDIDALQQICECLQLSLLGVILLVKNN